MSNEVINRPIEPMWSAAKIAAYLGVTPKTVYRWMWNGTLPSVRVGNTRRARQSDVQRLVNQRQVAVEDEAISKSEE